LLPVALPTKQIFYLYGSRTRRGSHDTARSTGIVFDLFPHRDGHKAR